jgi:hypothetical protein
MNKQRFFYLFYYDTWNRGIEITTVSQRMSARISLPSTRKNSKNTSAGFGLPGRPEIQTFNDKFGPLLIGDDVANTIHYIVTQPPHVHISDIVVRPTRQDYP